LTGLFGVGLFGIGLFGAGAALAQGEPPGDTLSALLDGEIAEDLGATLSVEGVCIPAGPAEVAERTRCVLQIVASPDEIATPGGALRLTVAVATFGDEREVHRRSLRTGPLAGASAWVYLVPFELPEASSGIAVLLETVSSGAALAEEGASRWGGAVVELVPEPLTVPNDAALVEGAPLGIQGAKVSSNSAAQAIRVLPPKRQPASGRTRFDTLVSLSGVDRVEFSVDGEGVARDGFDPFSATLNLASPPRPQTIRVVAYGRGDLVLGEDTLEVNAGSGQFRVAITEVSGQPASGSVEVAATVDVPPNRSLDRVELYFNEDLVQRLETPPFRAKVPTPTAGPTDYIRVAAFLDDGSTIDAVELLAAAGAVERVDVNLAELYVVVTNAEGQPVVDLTPEDFRIRVRKEEQEIQSFRFARDVPLLLGLVIDSSGSMETVMAETKQAAGHFLGESLRQGDRAFLVDFDSQPRLAHPASSSLADLTRAFRTLHAEGFTALYDSIVFSMLHFGTDPGRKALVVLTDGDDYRSRFGPDRAVKDARASGAPVYIIGLGDPRLLRKAYKQNNLDDMAEKTGGRVFLAADPVELIKVYDQINAELRSQYLLTFDADPETEVTDVKVEVTRPGLEVRTVVGAR